MAAIREALGSTGGDMVAAGSILRERMSAWAAEAAGTVSQVVRECAPAVIVTSLFGVEVLNAVAPECPWAVVNSTFYVGPAPPRALEEDFGFAGMLKSASLVLHATDPVFDFSFDGLPDHHHYTGPLGIWEPPGEIPAYVAKQGDPWVLVTISSQLQDDLPLAEAALEALADRPLRVLLTIGPDHEPAEVRAVPSNAHVEKTVSHAAVLERGALLVSHAGHGSVMKALWHGRPMVLVPWGRDQPGVAARATALGVARSLPRDDAAPDKLAAAIDAVLADEGMRQQALSHSERLRTTDPAETAAERLETLL